MYGDYCITSINPQTNNGALITVIVLASFGRVALKMNAWCTGVKPDCAFLAADIPKVTSLQH